MLHNYINAVIINKSVFSLCTAEVPKSRGSVVAIATGSGANAASYPMGTGGLFPRG
jgi:hypothetical protein